MNRNALISALAQYQTSSTEEKNFIPRFLEILKEDNCYQRSRVAGHITGSAWIITEDHQWVLMVHHRKLDKWLQPGGHADGDEDILAVAYKEAKEETGLTGINQTGNTFFDIDIHTIPAYKKTPAHEHFDIRFLFYANKNESLIISEESKDVAWKPIVQLIRDSSIEKSISRMALKTQKLD
ncbi:MAG: NUDIX hydrolase [Cyclobacteriaceae bacterium]